jgi:hypothetical protein
MPELSRKKLKLLHKIATDPNIKIKTSKTIRALKAAGADVRERLAETACIAFNGNTATLPQNNINYWKEDRAISERPAKNNNGLKQLATNVVLSVLIKE